MGNWIVTVLAIVVGLEFLCIMMQQVLLHHLAKEVDRNRPIEPVRIAQTVREYDDATQHWQPYWIGPEVPEDDDGR